MRIIRVKDDQEMSQKAAEMVIAKMRKNPSLTLGLATGETPIGTYRLMIEDHQRNGASYQQATTFNLDEYVGLPGENDQSYRYFMNKYLLDHIDIKKERTHIPDGNAADVQQECVTYERLIAEHGGIDLQIVGIGRNGHIGFNEPGTPFDTKTHIIELTPSTREANAKFFGRIEDVPTHAITMGIATIYASKEIIMLITGESKREALNNLIHRDINEAFPASALKRHPNFIIIADEAALGEN
ncbi:glucosamine-6-phosphate deaminase [Ammoniphilus oxalaticus]|uniref:Glucosamine-6-phosphate deaminase n=1 Tax=Ammoniphilus oxalaticus TaxID=66863 RepID=A0A419SMA4_9BACL|nr:glucosamine-6-phosphate deaminase [Ammoniphilus oxalaticus]RKD25145.1 glucosamine-6-phosphate deaminase [Ammoniphilus oxalaticus]